MSAESEIDYAYFCDKTFEDADVFKYDNDKVLIQEQPKTEKQKPKRKRKISGDNMSKKTTLMEHYIKGDVARQDTSTFHIDQQLLKVHTDYLNKIRQLTPENNPFLLEIEKTIVEIRNKIDMACCQICRNIPDTHPLRLMSEICGHKFCCGSCASEYIKLSEKNYVCLVCKKESKITCC